MISSDIKLSATLLPVDSSVDNIFGSILSHAAPIFSSIEHNPLRTKPISYDRVFDGHIQHTELTSDYITLTMGAEKPVHIIDIMPISTEPMLMYAGDEGNGLGVGQFEDIPDKAWKVKKNFWLNLIRKDT